MITLNNEDIIWRYMDLSKFIDLLTTKSLYLTRSDLFMDPFEGSYPKFNAEKKQLEIDNLATSLKEKPNPLRIYDGQEWINFMLIGKSNQQSLNDLFKKQRLTKYINCWHKNNLESDAMWRLYLDGNEGIAIKSTIGQLKKAINNSDQLILDEVRYLDYDTEQFQQNDSRKYGNITPFLYKRKHFAHENEVRIIQHKIFSKDSSDKYKDFDSETQLMTKGIKIEVDLNELIESIYVSPYAKAWFYPVVESVIEHIGKNNGLSNINLKGSNMNCMPRF